MPSLSAIPGLAQPGYARPGTPSGQVTPGPSGWIFTEVFACFYLQYLDTATGHTLAAQPGGTYSMMPCDPTPSAVPPADGRWVPA